MSRTREIVLPYGDEQRIACVPETQLAWVLSPRDIPSITDIPNAVHSALREPIGSPPLAQLVAERGHNVVVLVDDNTRSTPQHLLLPSLLDELNDAGVPDEEIILLIALGTHRPMTEAEMQAHYGKEVMERVRVENLDNTNPDAFVDLEPTRSGIPIQVARRYYEADLSIAVGNIVPHMYTGWSGGAKMVQPGVCSHLTTCKTHIMAGPKVHEALGDLNNPVRQEIDEIGLRSGLGFIINTVLNRHHEVVRIVAGHPIAAHREGVTTAREIYGVQVPELVDIVVASSNPADRDVWQGIKPLNAAGMTVRPGGEVILLIPAPEGFAPDHPAIVDFECMSAQEILACVARGECSDEVAAAAYLAMDVTRQRARITLVSDSVNPADARRVGLELESDLNQAIAAALDRVGPDARVGVITHAADLLPLMAI